MISNPWRYRCPDCGSVQVRERRGHVGQRQEVQELTPRERATDYKSFEDIKTAGWYCDGCQQPVDNPVDLAGQDSKIMERTDG